MKPVIMTTSLEALCVSMKLAAGRWGPLTKTGSMITTVRDRPALFRASLETASQTAQCLTRTPARSLISSKSTLSAASAHGSQRGLRS